jgi:hypothetical protein
MNKNNELMQEICTDCELRIYFNIDFYFKFIQEHNEKDKAPQHFTYPSYRL